MSNTLESFITKCAEDCVNANSVETTDDTFVGAWVKIPGLLPDEPNALNYLTLTQLEKLRVRVEVAIDQAERKIARLEAIAPGDRVFLKRYYLGMTKGIEGIVNHRRMIAGEKQQPDDYLSVTFQQYGTNWVPVGFVTKEAI